MAVDIRGCLSLFQQAHRNSLLSVEECNDDLPKGEHSSSMLRAIVSRFCNVEHVHAVWLENVRLEIVVYIFLERLSI